MKTTAIVLFLSSALFAQVSLADERDGTYHKISGSDQCPTQITISVNDFVASVEKTFANGVVKNTYSTGVVKNKKLKTETEVSLFEFYQNVYQRKFLGQLDLISSELYANVDRSLVYDFDLLYRQMSTGEKSVKEIECHFNR